jgi:peptidoglycan hydrolase CwlO-like protein
MKYSKSIGELEDEIEKLKHSLRIKDMELEDERQKYKEHIKAMFKTCSILAVDGYDMGNKYNSVCETYTKTINDLQRQLDDQTSRNNKLQMDIKAIKKYLDLASCKLNKLM